MQRPTRSLSGHGTIVSVGERTFPVFYMLSEIGERPMIGTLDLLGESMPFLAGTWLFESTVRHQLRLANGQSFTFAIRTYDRTGRLEIESVGDRDMESIETGDHEDVGLSGSSLDPRGLDVPWQGTGWQVTSMDDE